MEQHYITLDLNEHMADTTPFHIAFSQDDTYCFYRASANVAAKGGISKSIFLHHLKKDSHIPTILKKNGPVSSLAIGSDGRSAVVYQEDGAWYLYWSGKSTSKPTALTILTRCRDGNSFQTESVVVQEWQA